MCGRYAASAGLDDLIEEFEVDEDGTAAPTRSVLVAPPDPPPGTPDYNMAPSKEAPVVLTRRPRSRSDADDAPGAEPTRDPEPTRQLRLLTWGLVPSWAKDTKAGYSMINARRESVLDKPAFRTLVESRRCLVPARGWFEWQKSPVATDRKGKPRKQPFFISRVDSDLLAFAGLYEFWRDPAVPEGADPRAWLTTFTIITTSAEPGLDRIHDRQPLVLDHADWARWLDPDARSQDVADLLGQPDPERFGRFAAYPVGLAVSNARNNGAQLLDPAPDADLVGVVDPATGELIG